MARRRAIDPAHLLAERGAELYGLARLLAGEDADVLLGTSLEAAFAAGGAADSFGAAEELVMLAMRRATWDEPPRRPAGAAAAAGAAADLEAVLDSLDGRARVAGVARLHEDLPVSTLARMLRKPRADVAVALDRAFSRIEAEWGPAGLSRDEALDGGTETMLIDVRAGAR